MKVLDNITINEDLIVTSQITLSGEIVVNSNIIVKEGGKITIKGATLYFDNKCGITSEGLVEAINSTFDAKRLQWEKFILTGKSESYIKNCSISNGAGLVVGSNTNNIVIDGCTIVGCKNTGYGGAISSVGKNITIRNCKIQNCSAKTGGGIYARDTTVIERCIIEDCHATNGGGLYLDGGDIKNSKINNCISEQGAGGIYIGGKNTTISSSTIFKCISRRVGGGMKVQIYNRTL